MPILLAGNNGLQKSAAALSFQKCNFKLLVMKGNTSRGKYHICAGKLVTTAFQWYPCYVHPSCVLFQARIWANPHFHAPYGSYLGNTGGFLFLKLQWCNTSKFGSDGFLQYAVSTCLFISAQHGFIDLEKNKACSKPIANELQSFP
jgi:hypothetical protein